QLKEHLGLFVSLGGGHESDVHTAYLVDLVVVDLREDKLLLEAEGEVAAAVEAICADTSEVSDAGQSHAEQSVEELVHHIASEGHLDAYHHALADLEVRDRLLGAAYAGPLAGNGGDIVHDRIDHLLVVAGLAAANIDDDLIQLGDLHDA